MWGGGYSRLEQPFRVERLCFRADGYSGLSGDRFPTAFAQNLVSLEVLDGSFSESMCNALRGLKALTSLHVWGRTEDGPIMV